MITLLDDTEIAFDDIGTGVPLVFLHAFPLNRTMWEPQVSALVAEYRCVTIDWGGFGGFPPPRRRAGWGARGGARLPPASPVGGGGGGGCGFPPPPQTVLHAAVLGDE